eukprot:CAMPEP_0201517008 /NCGR_PEP_ID=MMETSP0161_2-20130828/8232_1 /ASSEMBLY_ACC=CAM_ASM_000251 /TAXON_ID=180227 /ORGANISM="Neoparamoeba aestuarina, Strain SoJaBio B1-5/56/2" /LENGTH=292 /DNA_ID=CAMNT_0047914383 /DNA_START=360 /DNA_END=1238 /DNA_ORIENTATION=+
MNKGKEEEEQEGEQEEEEKGEGDKEKEEEEEEEDEREEQDSVSSRLRNRTPNRISRSSSSSLSSSLSSSSSSSFFSKKKQQPKKVQILLTSVVNQANLKKSIKKLGGTMVDDICSSVTHVVTTGIKSKSGHFPIARRTVKYLYGILSHSIVVSVDWIKKSAEKGEWMDEEEFEIIGDSICGLTNGPCLSRMCPNVDLFENYFFYLLGPFDSNGISLGDVEKLIKFAGGESKRIMGMEGILAEQEKERGRRKGKGKEKIIFVVTTANHRNKNLKVKEVRPSWITNSISHFEIQ